MGRRKTHEPLRVALNGKTVGLLERQSTGALRFQYADTWLNWPHALPVSLSLPLRRDPYLGDPVSHVFENLLPDRADIRQRLAETTGAQGTDAFSLLTQLGRDCVGALRFTSMNVDDTSVASASGTRLRDKDVANILRALHQQPLGAASDDDSFRISIAGAQDKTALLHWRKAWHLPKGATPTTHIFKPAMGPLPNGMDLSDSVENEFLCLKITQALGLATAQAEILAFEDIRVLAVKRFDRQWTSDGTRILRLPQEDLCQALSIPPSLKYQSAGGPNLEQLLTLLSRSDTPLEDQLALLRAQMVFFLLAATDGHAKNFSIQLFPGARFRLAPLYDVISVQPYLAAKQIREGKVKLAMSVGDKRHYVVKTLRGRHFMQSAARASMPAKEVEALIEDLLDTVPAKLLSVRDALPKSFPNALADAVLAGVTQRLPLLRLHP